jgi:HEAT repeat protein
MEALKDELKDENEGVRRAATKALGELGDPQAVPALMEAIKVEDGGVRHAAAKALGKIGAPAISALIQALQDENRRVRWAAAEALGQIGDPQATPALIQALRDEDVEVRQAAAWALEKIGPPAVPALIQALQDEDGWVRRAAAEALLKLLPISLPQNEQERRAWQKRMASIRWAARGAKEYELLAAVLERQAAWEAALSPWQDPLQPPPVPAWRAWARRAGGGALVLLIAGLVALAMAVLPGIGEPLSEAVRAFVQRQPLWAAALLILILGAAVALLDWIREALRKKT